MRVDDTKQRRRELASLVQIRTVGTDGVGGASTGAVERGIKLST